MGSKIADLCISSHVRSRNSSLPNVRVNKIEKKCGKEVEKAKHYNQKKEWGCKQQNQSAASATRKHWLTDGNNNVTEEADWVTRSRASRGPSLRDVLALLESDDATKIEENDMSRRGIGRFPSANMTLLRVRP